MLFRSELQRDAETFFVGLGHASVGSTRRQIAWDKRVYCVAKERAEECFSFIGGIAFSNPKTGLFANVFSYDLVFPDPTSPRNQWLSVKVFGVITNTFIALLENRYDKPPRARKIIMPSAEAGVLFLRQRGVMTHFTGEDPLQMRD